jgi:hypothetical protein
MSICLNTGEGAAKSILRDASHREALPDETLPAVRHADSHATEHAVTQGWHTVGTLGICGDVHDAI